MEEDWKITGFQTGFELLDGLLVLISLGSKRVDI